MLTQQRKHKCRPIRDRAKSFWRHRSKLFLERLEDRTLLASGVAPDCNTLLPTSVITDILDPIAHAFGEHIHVDDIPEPGWIWVDPSSDSTKFREVTGTVMESFVTHSDFPVLHDSHDQNTIVDLDPGQGDLISPANDPNEIEVEWEINDFPSWAWPNVGDRVWFEGHHIYDCGHPNPDGLFRAEIHPPRAVASMREQLGTLPGTGTTPVNIINTDLYIHGVGGYATDLINDSSLFFTGGYGTHTTTIAKDFDFDIQLKTLLPQPAPGAVLMKTFENGPGNTVAGFDPVLDLDTSDPANPLLHVHVPLGGSGVADTETYARIIKAGWVFPSGELRHLTLTLDHMVLHQDKDTDPGDCECVFFLNVPKTPSDE